MNKIFVIIFCLLFTIAGFGQKKDLTPILTIPKQYKGNDPFNIDSYFQIDHSRNASIEELSKKLDEARDNNDAYLSQELQAKINSLVGNNSGPTIKGPIPQLESGQTGIVQEDAIGITRVAIGDVWSQATTTQNTNGRIWIASSHYSSSVGDTLRLFYSDNGGISWTYFGGFNFGSPDVDFRTDELDIEVLYDGANWWIYVVGGVVFQGIVSSFVARWRDDGTGYFFDYLPQPLFTIQNWPRIVSDYPKYTNLAQVMIVATLDSNITGPTHDVKTRAFVISNPYAGTPTILNRNGPNGAYSWHSLNIADSCTLRSDIGYFDSLTAGNRVVTVSCFENSIGGEDLFFSYSSSYMAAAPISQPVLGVIFQTFRPVIAYSGADNHIAGCITFVQKFLNGPDWDPVLLRTNNGGANWTIEYAESSDDTTFKSDIIGLKGINGQFKVGWINRNAPNPEFLYSSVYIGSSTTIIGPYNMDGGGIYPNTIWGGRAGYKLSGQDSCFAVYGSTNATENVYAVSGCNGPITNISSSHIPANFSLSQNFPNPFNPSTSINYDIPSEGFVKLSIYDIVGREVAVLVNDRKIAGSYRIDFNAEGLSSGVYFYKITAGNFTDIKKMMLIK